MEEDSDGAGAISNADAENSSSTSFVIHSSSFTILSSLSSSPSPSSSSSFSTESVSIPPLPNIAQLLTTDAFTLFATLVASSTFKSITGCTTLTLCVSQCVLNASAVYAKPSRFGTNDVSSIALAIANNFCIAGANLSDATNALFSICILVLSNNLLLTSALQIRIAFLSLYLAYVDKHRMARTKCFSRIHSDNA